MNIPISFVLREDIDMQQLRMILQSLDIEVTGIGKATLSGRLSLAKCEKLFNVHITPHQPEPPGKDGMGVPGGFSTDSSPTILKELDPFVTTVNITPPLSRL